MNYLDLLYIALYGFIDSISFHKTIPLLVNNFEVLTCVGKILGANLLLLVGSNLMFENLIHPSIAYYSQNGLGNMTNITISTIFQVMWLVPMYVICYGCSTLWYQDLSNLIDSSRSKKTKVDPKNNSAAQKVYANLIWLFTFIEFQLLFNAIPGLCSTLVAWFCGNKTTFMSIILHSLSNSSHIIGIIVQSYLYGWYSFDPHWLSLGLEPDTRFSILESKFIYFIGFGAPYSLLMKSTSFFVGYGIFLALFPFSIILGSLSDCELPYRQFKSLKTSGQILKLPKIVTKRMLQLLNAPKAKKRIA